jgi:hypothetical protein
VDNHGDKHSESSLIGKESEFLIKGLKPGKTYNVSVPSSAGFISIPESHRIVMGKSDKLNVRIFFFMGIGRFHSSGKMEGAVPERGHTVLGQVD